MLPLINKKKLEKQGYRFVGNHSAVKICTWTKKSLVDRDVCYKQKFYNIKSHQCCQMTPCLLCTNSCEFCWRSMDYGRNAILKEGIDDPKKIVEQCIEAQKELLNGFPGNKELNLKKFNEAQTLKYWAISLVGEPTIYPLLGDLIEYLHKRKNCSFLVTNGMFPKKLESLSRSPTQLYVSLDAPNKNLYKKIDRPLLNDYWKRLNNTLELLPLLDTRTVLRITAVKNLNMCDEKGYAELIKKSKADFVEVKSYMWVGSSRERLTIENMPLHKDIKAFGEKLAELTGLKIIDEKKESRVVLLAEKDTKKRFIKL